MSPGKAQHVVQGEIEKLATDASGVLRRSGQKTVFVEGALPGEQIEAVITEEKSRFARAKTLSVCKPSVMRSPARCPHYGSCGGCQLQHVESTHQPALKAAWFQEACARLGKWPQSAQDDLLRKLEIRPLAPWAYRRRVRLHFGPPPSGGAFVLGYATSGRGKRGGRRAARETESSPPVMAITACPILHPALSASLAVLAEALTTVLKAKPLPLQIELTVLNPKEQATSSAIGLVAYHAGRDRKALSAKLERKIRLALMERGVAVLDPDRTSEVVPLEGFTPDKSKTDESRAEAPPMDRAVFHLRGFVQPHRDAPTTYSALVAEIAAHSLPRPEVPPGEQRTFWDLYGGSGLFTQALLKVSRSLTRPGAQPLLPVLVEQSPWSIQAARELFRDEGVLFEECDVGAFLSRFLAQKIETQAWPALIVADPPRSGLGENVTANLAEILRKAHKLGRKAPELIVVFCDPAACARDVGQLLLAGFLLERAVIVDAFAQTKHYECVIHLHGGGV